LPGDADSVIAGQRQVGVFIDYWWVYSSARLCFPGETVPPPSWFGNVSPRGVARLLVKRPPASVRRSERGLGGLHIFVRHYDPELHRSQQERVERWQAEDAVVHVGPSREEGGGYWQSSVSVALAVAVTSALERGEYDAAVVFAGDGALLPLFQQLAGRGEEPARIELATWVAPDGTVPSGLPVVPGVWCHRLGEASFRQVIDDRRLQRPKPQVGHLPQGHQGPRPGPGARLRTPPTAMAAALAAAGIAEADAARGRTHSAPGTPPPAGPSSLA
jgi:hypothetical protein